MGRTSIKVMASCHPDELHEAKGLCKACYFKQHYARNFDIIQEKARKSYNPKVARAYYDANREHILTRQRAYREANRDTINTKMRAGILRWSYGMSVADYDTMLASQGGVCAICERLPELRKGRQRLFCVDHNHTTGKVRGLLCDPCNIAIAYLHEDLLLFEKAAAYIKEKQSI